MNGTNFYQGNQFSFDLSYKLAKQHDLGLEIGFFYFQKKDPHVEHYLMKYSYFPLSLFYKRYIKKNFFKIEIGTNLLSYFDSNYFLSENLSSYNKTFWPAYHATDHVSSLEKRKKHWFIISPSYNFKIIKNLHILTGFTLLLGNRKSFGYLNFGINYKIMR